MDDALTTWHLVSFRQAITCELKPKFHYADFPVTTATDPWPLPRWLPCVLSRKSPISLFPRRKRDCCRLVTGVSQTISTCRDGLKWFETPKLPHDFRVTWNLGFITNTFNATYKTSANIISRLLSPVSFPISERGLREVTERMACREARCVLQALFTTSISLMLIAKIIYCTSESILNICKNLDNQARQEGEERKFSRSPRRLGAPPSPKNT